MTENIYEILPQHIPEVFLWPLHMFFYHSQPSLADTQVLPVVSGCYCFHRGHSPAIASKCFIL